jgi:hypothetical protein
MTYVMGNARHELKSRPYTESRSVADDGRLDHVSATSGHDHRGVAGVASLHLEPHLFAVTLVPAPDEVVATSQSVMELLDPRCEPLPGRRGIGVADKVLRNEHRT